MFQLVCITLSLCGVEKIYNKLKRMQQILLMNAVLMIHECKFLTRTVFVSHLPGVWKLILRSSTGSVGWWEDMALLHGKLPFLPSASALFLE